MGVITAGFYGLYDLLHRLFFVSPDIINVKLEVLLTEHTFLVGWLRIYLLLLRLLNILKIKFRL